MIRRLSLLSAVCSLLCACFSWGAKPDPADDLRKVLARYDEGVRAMDSAGIAAMYTPDGEMRLPNDVIRGQDAIRAYLRTFEGKFRVIDNDTTIQALEVHGDIASVTTAFRQRTLIVESDQIVQPHGTLHSEWVRMPDGSWRIKWMSME